MALFVCVALAYNRQFITEPIRKTVTCRNVWNNSITG